MSKREENDQIKNERALDDLRAVGGIIAKGAWQTGTGNYKKARAVPAGAKVFAKWEADQAPANVAAWFAAHPRAERCVAICE